MTSLKSGSSCESGSCDSFDDPVSLERDARESALDKFMGISPRKSLVTKIKDTTGEIVMVVGDMGEKQAQKKSSKDFGSNSTVPTLSIKTQALLEEMESEDPIFTLKEPVSKKNYITLPECPCCNKVLTRKKKYCNFCGQSICPTCIVRKKMLPKAPTNSKRYSICKICDRKFFLKHLHEQYNQKINEKETKRVQYQMQVQEKRNQLTVLETKIAATERNNHNMEQQKEMEARSLQNKISIREKDIDTIHEKINILSDEAKFYETNYIAVEEEINEYERLLREKYKFSYANFNREEELQNFEDILNSRNHEIEDLQKQTIEVNVAIQQNYNPPPSKRSLMNNRKIPSYSNSSVLDKNSSLGCFCCSKSRPI